MRRLLISLALTHTISGSGSNRFPNPGFMGKHQEERKTPVIVVKKRRTFSPPSL
ncbi:TPA: hypothetical protein ACUE58_004439 [Escherichia coli]